MRLGRFEIRLLLALVAAAVLCPDFGHAFGPSQSTDYKRPAVGTSVGNRNSDYNVPTYMRNYKFKFDPSQLPSSNSKQSSRQPTVGGDSQPRVPEIVGLPDVRRGVGPEFKPASLNRKSSEIVIPRIKTPTWVPILSKASTENLKIKAKALYCVDRSSNKIILAENVSSPLPIASITKLLTAMVVIDDMKLDSRIVTPHDIREVEKHTVGIRPGDIFSVQDLLHGMLIESGNDCAEALARAYPKGGRAGFIKAMNRKAEELGASSVKIFTPSGLDHKFIIGRKDGRELQAKKPNISTAQDVALIADHAFKYPLIAQISSSKKHTMRTLNEKPRDYPLYTNDKLLDRNLPVAGAKTGFTNMAGKCIVALFKDDDKEHLVVVLNTAQHFKAAEKIYRWAAKSM